MKEITDSLIDLAYPTSNTGDPAIDSPKRVLINNLIKDLRDNLDELGESQFDPSILDDITEENYTTAEKNKLEGISPNATANSEDSYLLDRANHTGTQSVETITGLGEAATKNLNVAGGVAGIDPATGKVPQEILPTNLAPIIEVADYSALPVPGNSDVIYVTLNDSKSFRWTGSIYLDITSGGGASEALKLTNARGIKVGATSKNFDGTASIEFTPTEIGISDEIDSSSSTTFASSKAVNDAREWNNIKNKPIGGYVPAGTIVAYAGNTIPSGWLLCDGTAYSSLFYPSLYEAIGTTYGWEPQGGIPIDTLFKLPDLTGAFIRGTGGNAAARGVRQGDAIRNITGRFKVGGRLRTSRTHTVTSGSGAFSVTNGSSGSIDKFDNAFSGDAGRDVSFNAANATGVTTANENRPLNMAMYYIIKY